ncbi:MAG: family 1 glycosylhydrolase [Bacteroidota bacterium]
MKLHFPDHFFWGTSTAAAQIETAFDHNWKGLVSKDDFVFDRTSDHEKRRSEDVQYIKRFGSIYRCGVDWSKLQRAPFAPFEEEVVEEYQSFFAELLDEGMEIMFVLHHFLNPNWFEKQGGWLVESNIGPFVDYCRQCIEHFGSYVSNWNTFNEPNVYAMNAYMLGNFPPHKKSYRKANRVIKHMSQAHEVVYNMLKELCPTHPVGISQNTAWFDSRHPLGWLPAKFTDWWFNRRTAKYFTQVDYRGVSYYAYIPFMPFAVTEKDNPGKLAKLGIPHDKLWGYRPEGFDKIIRWMWKKYGKPIVITENGICTDDPQERIQSIKDYLKIIHQAIQDGIDVRGYVHWSTMDNFEWDLGPTYRFGLVHVNLFTKDRQMTEAGLFYEKVTTENAVEID